ncbi:hypothetical protein A2397_04805 [Candidatus Amesbacteria bacterium RIFOXYB1_FULL_44_23]|uniref:Uncharacterized protein n=1 Tax=Candidatus Amesbacteria bacterium RIFOXYB1_FULL_44_23 TaxID=1797263 RepID=A0A1F4ZVB6_9BACT|nr:MAG: hypothetical protein A2397_04805 [Candidatus Amesbacteria bacterium RIFOXYB1_FULL_44_23]
MTNPDILRRLDQTIAEQNTDWNTVLGLVAEAYAWMPFKSHALYDPEVESAQKYNEDQIRALRSSPRKLARAVRIKTELAEKSHLLLAAAHEKYGSAFLPRWSEKHMDIHGKYWDEVKASMEGQFEQLEDDNQVTSLAILLTFGMRLNIPTGW